MKKILIIMLLFAGLLSFKPAGTRHISGVVYAKDDRLPIPGASVKVEGTSVATQADKNGKYAIDAPDGANLKFSEIGYTTQTIAISQKDTINVYLETASQQLGEVVVTGALGIRTQTDQLGYSAANATANNLNKEKVPSYNSLTGRASGVNVVTKAPAAAKGVRSNTYIPPAAPEDESYKGINENTFNDVKNNPLSTFSVDVDGASYSNMRRFINNGQLPPANAVRIEEMINYFKYDLKGPTNGEPVAIHTELSSAPWNAKHRLLRIALKAKTIDDSKLPPSDLVFLIDVSGSMATSNKLPLAKAAMKMLADQLRPQDKVSIVTYAGEAGVALEPTPGDQKEKIMAAIDKLNAGGSTNGGEGIKTAYRIARENFMQKGNNRIILATDGDFNVGPNSDENMETLITRERDSKVAISILGFGMGNLKDSKMETMADKGNGNYFYIDNLTEARKALVSEFAGTLFTVAKDVKIQIEFNPSKVEAYRLLGYEDRMLAKEDFNNDRKDAGDMGSGHAVTALYEIIPAGIKDDFAGSVDPLKYQKNQAAINGKGSDELMTIKFRYKPNGSETSKMDLVAVKDAPVSFNAASADFRFAASVAEFGMLLRDSQFKQQATFDQAISIAKAAKGDDADGYRSEFVRLAESAKLLTRTSLAAY